MLGKTAVAPLETARHLRPAHAAVHLLALGVLAVSTLAPGQADAAAKKPKYYFDVLGVESTVASEEIKAAAKDILVKDLAARPQFTSDVPATGDRQALAAELKRRKLAGFLVTLKIDELVREPRPPREGRKLPQLSLRLKLSVFGTTISESKLAFGGEGEAEVVAEVIERRMEEEAAVLTKDALVQAVKQAVDQAVAKLSQPVSKPFNESKRPRSSSKARKP